jgi:phosphoglycolate phosphatase
LSETGVDLAHLSVIFDLDGTLIDSVPDIHATANRVMAELGFAPLARAEVQAFVGKGLPNLVARLLERHGQDPSGALHAPTMTRFEAEYLTAHSLTTLYPGVLAALSQLAARGAALGVCTNKPLAPACAVMDHLGLTPFFPTILGGDSLAVRKPHPDHLHATARALGRRGRKGGVLQDCLEKLSAPQRVGQWQVALGRARLVLELGGPFAGTSFLSE